MSENLTKAKDWKEWKEFCAYDSCGNEAKIRLGKFGQLRLKRYLGQIGEHLTNNLSLFSGSEKVVDGENERRGNFADTAWQLFDSRIITKGKINNKSCKDWLFENAGSLSMIEGRASNLFREVAREHARAEGGRHCDDSLDRPIKGAENLVLGDLMKSGEPSAADQLVFREMYGEAQTLAETFFSKLSKDRKVAILAKSEGISLDNSEVKRIAGKQKATLYENLKTDLAAFVESVSRMPGIENEKKGILAQAGLGFLYNAARSWGEKPENGCISIFKDNDD